MYKAYKLVYIFKHSEDEDPDVGNPVTLSASLVSIKTQLSNIRFYDMTYLSEDCQFD